MLSVSDYANQYFNEYKQACINDPGMALEEYQKWQDITPTIKSLSMKEQADYADYVTQKLLCLPRKPLNAYIIAELDEFFDENPKQIKASALANMALFILELPGKKKDKYVKLYKDWLKQVEVIPSKVLVKKDFIVEEEDELQGDTLNVFTLIVGIILGLCFMYIYSK